MRTSDGYRFSLQFGLASDAHRQVGDFLESLVNKKSEAVVAAVSEYLQAHPEALNQDNPVRVITAFGYTEETLNAKIEAVVRKISAGVRLNPPDHARLDDDQQDGGTNALDVLLGGLDRFI